MIKVILLVFSFGTFLSHLDAEVLSQQDDLGSNAESNGEQQLSLVSRWLQSAKEENRIAMEALNKTECPQDSKTRLELAKNELGQVDTASVQSAWLDLRRALRKEVSALQSMLKKYKIIGEGPCKNELLHAIYSGTEACFDIVKALATLKSNADLMRRLSVITPKLLAMKRQSTHSGSTELPNSMAELATLVLQLTESLSAEN